MALAFMERPFLPPPPRQSGGTQNTAKCCKHEVPTGNLLHLHPPPFPPQPPQLTSTNEPAPIRAVSPFGITGCRDALHLRGILPSVYCEGGGGGHTRWTATNWQAEPYQASMFGRGAQACLGVQGGSGAQGGLSQHARMSMEGAAVGVCNAPCPGERARKGTSVYSCPWRRLGSGRGGGCRKD